MRDKILQLIREKPRHYSQIIKKDSCLLSWVLSNTLINTDSLVENIRSAVYQETNICPNGNIRKISRINEGWTNCGPASICACTKQQIALGVSITKQSKTSEEKAAINDKRIITMMDKFGVAYNSQREDVKKILRKSKMQINQHELLSNAEWLNTEYVIKKRTSVDIAHDLNVHNSTVLAYCRQHGFKIRQVSNYSQQEIKLAQFIRDLNFDVDTNVRGLIGNSEVDVYVPSLQIGFEINGLLYHSYHPVLMNKNQTKENKNRHLQKTELAYKNNIQLFHYTDRQINTQWDIVKSNICSKLGVTENKIGARNCVLKPVDNTEARSFFLENHFQGHVPAQKLYGLYYQNQLVQCLTIGKHRYKAQGLELLRFATKLNYTVVGGLSRLLSAVVSDINEPLYTYCDRDISNGAAYVKAGFELIGYSDPGYFWTDGTEIISRYQSRKNRLQSWLPNYNPELSESENMFAAGFRRFYNTGNLILKLK